MLVEDYSGLAFGASMACRLLQCVIAAASFYIINVFYFILELLATPSRFFYCNLRLCCEFGDVMDNFLELANAGKHSWEKSWFVSPDICVCT